MAQGPVLMVQGSVLMVEGPAFAHESPIFCLCEILLRATQEHTHKNLRFLIFCTLAKTLRAGGTPLHSLDAFISTADAFISTPDAFSARSFPFPTPQVEGNFRLGEGHTLLLHPPRLPVITDYLSKTPCVHGRTRGRDTG